MKLTEQGTIHTCTQLEHKKVTNTPNRRMHLSKHLYHERKHRTTHTRVQTTFSTQASHSANVVADETVWLLDVKSCPITII